MVRKKMMNKKLIIKVTQLYFHIYNFIIFEKVLFSIYYILKYLNNKI